MPNYWLINITEENWEVTRREKIFGSKNELPVSKGDYLIFRITKKGCRQLCNMIVGVYEVISDQYVDETPLWPDEKRGEANYRYRVRLSEVVTGRLSYDEVRKLPSLEKKLLAGTIVGRNPIPEEDAKVIIDKLRGETSKEVGLSQRVVERSLHDEVKRCLEELGSVRGFRVEMEYPSPDGVYKYDVVWIRPPSRVPTKIFEVIDTSSVDLALSRLKHAKDVWERDRGLYIVFVNERDMVRAEKLLEPRLSGAFHEIRGAVKPLLADKVLKLCNVVREVEDVVRELLVLED
ncbi:MAG: EVE domain-containing protein [Vulcanisaeta sp. AZ3]